MVDANDRLTVPPGEPQYTLRRVWLDHETEERYYYGLANEALWPLCHVAFQRPAFRLSDWQSYQRANQIFADAVIEEADGGAAVVFIQDYHFALLPRILKRRNPNLTVAQFWHIPWPNRETFRAFPWKEELLDGLLGNDLLGFHLGYHCVNFLDTVDCALEAMADREHNNIRYGGTLTRVRPFPISIDFDRHIQQADDPSVYRQMDWWRRELGGGYQIGIGIDRADYTKGIPERLLAVDRFLETHPEYRGRLVFLQIAVPSRTQIGSYQRLNQEIDGVAAEINDRWGDSRWRPVRICKRHLPEIDMMALHRLADFCMVTSLHDGMNLVAKEFVASRNDESGVLVLSTFTGAARELTSALQVNPFSADQMADAIWRALTMASAEQGARMQRLRKTVRENNVYRWAVEIMGAALEVADSHVFESREDPAAVVSVT